MIRYRIYPHVEYTAPSQSFPSALRYQPAQSGLKLRRGEGGGLATAYLTGGGSPGALCTAHPWPCDMNPVVNYLPIDRLITSLGINISV